ncbi:DUF192 domain-containing protein [Gemmatimonadota bacterium]
MSHFARRRVSPLEAIPKASSFLLALLLLPGCGPPPDGVAAEATRGGAEAGGPALQERLPPPGEAWVIFENDTVRAEVARTEEQRQKGLMYRESLPAGRGMLFVFTDSMVRSFWMQNTYIALDIAYIDAGLHIVDIQAMEPQTTDLHPSARPAMFALEVPMGWFEAKGIGVGAQVRIVFGPGGGAF